MSRLDQGKYPNNETLRNHGIKSVRWQEGVDADG